MIAKTGSNRKLIIEFLDNCSEDELIDEIIIPLYNSNGYSLVRKVSHGSGEHGKDIVFSKFNKSFLDMEYLIVQAKAQQVTVGNVVDFSNQLIRALRTPVAGLNGTANIYPNFVVFFNARKTSNDAQFEFPYLIDGKNNIKLINQDLAYELMINNSIIPETIMRKITIEDSSVNEQEQQIKSILNNNKANEIDSLFNYILPTYPDISVALKSVIIEYIFYIWNEDKSWDGTVKPMKWLAKYFSYIQPNQYPYLQQVVSEYLNENHSYQARTDTCNIFKQINRDMLKMFSDDYVIRISNIIFNRKDDQLAFDKLLEIDETTITTTERAKSLWPVVKEYISIFNDRSKDSDTRKEQLKNKRKELQTVFWGKEFEE